MPEPDLRQFEFGEFVLDRKRGSLERAGEDMALRPQAFEVLSFLADHSGTLVSKDKLHHAVWRGASVTDDSLTQCIVEIRKAIGDHAHTIVRTIPKRGFIFDPPEPSRSGSTDLVRKPRKLWFSLAAIATFTVIVFAALSSNTGDAPDPFIDGLYTAMSPNSVAVLPFIDLSQEQDQQYFGDGLAEEILSKLTEYSDLVVIARTSSFLFRDRQEDVAAIGRGLNSAYVLEGSIRKSGSRLRITARLVDTRRGTQVWAQSFDRELTVRNFLDIQSEVAVSVAESIASGESTSNSRRERVHEAANTQAYDLYLEGMFYLQQIRAPDRAWADMEVFEAAIERFEAAIDYDPDWAALRAALGRTLIIRGARLQDIEDDEAYDWYRLARLHLLEAVRLDPDFGRAYSSLADVLHRLDFDFTAAEAAYARSRELGGYSHWEYAYFLTRMGRFDESIEQYQLAIERDPLSVGPRHQLASTYRCAGRDAESIELLETILRLAPGHDNLYMPLAYLYLKTGNVEEGRELFEQYSDPESTSIEYGPIYVLLGRVDEAYAAMEQAEAAERWWLEYYVGTALALGETARALDYLETASGQDPRRLMHVRCIWGIQSLADDARFRQMLRQAGYSDHLFQQAR